MSCDKGVDAQVKQPRVSIVTPSYNQAQFLEETILSVLGQDYPNIEYIVIDGGSTDASVEIIKKYEDRLAYWVSEPDRGQSHAINKGWQRATGEIVAYLNSDDLYTPGAVVIAVQALLSHPLSCMVYSDALFIDQHSRHLRRVRGAPFDVAKVLTTDVKVPQPTMFVRRSALDKVGLLDEHLHMVMDYDLWLRLGFHYPATYVSDACLAKMREHAGAKSTAALDAFPAERRRVLNRLFAMDELPLAIKMLRRRAYGTVAWQQAQVAGYAGQPDRIWAPLLRALVACPSYVLKRPLAIYLVGRGLIPLWKGHPSPRVWSFLDRVLESLHG